MFFISDWFDIPVAALIIFCSEGYNIPDAEMLVNSLLQFKAVVKKYNIKNIISCSMFSRVLSLYLISYLI